MSKQKQDKANIILKKRLSIFKRKWKTIKEHGIVWAIRERFWPYTLWLCVHMIIFIMRPIVRVKFVLLRTGRIGHLAYNTDIFIRKFLSKQTNQNAFLVIITDDLIANNYLFDLWRQKIREICKNRTCFIHHKTLCAILGPLRFTKTTLYFENGYLLYDFAFPFYTFATDKTFLHIAPNDEEKGRQLLRSMGVNSWFICFHARDSVYGNRLTRSLQSANHDFRNCDISNYIKAAEYITTCGGFALRAGYGVVQRLPVAKNNPRIIDYAANYRSEFGDIYLFAKAKYFLASDSGPFAVSSIFGVPVAVANFIPLEVLTCFRKGDLFIPKKIWSHEKKRLLTFREIFELGVNRYRFIREDSPSGIEVIENSPEEILGLAREMNERLDGIYKYTDEDEELQNRFHSLIKPCHLCYGTPVRIGAKFLQANKELLE